VGTIPLDGLPEWSEDIVANLRGVGITTAQQVVAIAATSDGIHSLTEQLDLSENDVRQLVESARASLTSEELSELEAPVDTGEFGLGAQPPPEDPEDR